jgi:hypothetical protein
MSSDSPLNASPQFGQLNAATIYTRLGFALTPIPYGGKGPTIAGWNELERLVRDEDEAKRIFGGRPTNMGVQHQASGTCAIDIDDAETTRMIFESFGLDYDGMVHKGMRIYSKPNRDKLLFLAPEGLDLEQVRWPKKVQSKPNDVFTIFEMRAGPNQDVLPPSRHPDGHFYVWRDGRAPWDFDEFGGMPTLPDDVAQFWRAYSDPATGIKDAVRDLCPWAPKVGPAAPVRARSAGKHGDLIGQFNDANDVGEMLENNGYKRRGKRYLAPSSSTIIPGVVILDGGKCYSHHGSDILADGYAHDAFDLLVTLEHGGNMRAALDDAARQLGVDRYAQPMPGMTDAEIDQMLALSAARRGAPAAAEPAVERASPGGGDDDEDDDQQRQSRADPQYPPSLQSPPGIVGEIADWILDTSADPQPMLAVAGALSAVGAALAQQVMTTRRARTNLYLVGLARTGFGKDHARKAVKKLLEKANLGPSHIGGEELPSGAGVRAAVARRPGCVFLVDELGNLLASMKHRNASPHLAGIVDALLKMFSSTDGILYGAEYADQKLRARVDIPYPCAGVYGTTVPGSFYDSLDSQSIASGFLNRLLIVEASGRRPVHRPDRYLDAVPERLSGWLQAASKIIPLSELPGATSTPGEYPVAVSYTPGAERLMHEFAEWVNGRIDALQGTPKEPLGELWSRASEHASKVALVVGVGMTTDAAALESARHTMCLRIDERAAEWAIEFVRSLVTHVELAASTRMGDSEHDRLAQQVLQVLHGAEQGRTEAELSKFCRPYRAASPSMRDAVLDMLKRDRRVRVGQRLGRNGRSFSTIVSNERAPPGVADGVAAGQ